MVDFALNTEFSDLPPKTVLLAKRCILDCIGVTLAGSVDPLLRKIVNGLLKDVGGTPRCTVIGTGQKTSAPYAALANGTFGHLLDFDDINWIYQGHFSVVLLPASLAIGEIAGSTGKEILTAYLVALQSMCKLGAAMVEFGDHYKRGWHATGTIGTLGAAVTAAKLLKLERKQFMNALGLAAGSAAGLRNNFGTLAKSFQAGRAAESGVLAALLARRGMTGSGTAIEGEMGLVEAGTEKHDYQRIGNFRSPWGILDERRGAVVKAYPALGGGVGAIDAMISLANDHDLKPSQVKSIVCERADVSSFLPKLPRTGLEGKFSMHFWMATALLERNVQLSDFTDERVRSPEITGLMRRVRLRINPHIPLPSIRVTVQTIDGRSLRKTVWPPRGTPENPMSDSEIIQKFNNCAEYAKMKEARISKLVETVTHLENLKHIRDLTKLC